MPSSDFAIPTPAPEYDTRLDPLARFAALPGSATRVLMERYAHPFERCVLSSAVMHRSLAIVVVLLFVVGVGATASAQSADLQRALGNLKHEDFRVRTQAALALGASKDPRVAAPLCSALLDSNLTVRAAAAAALGRLPKAGEDCLEKRLEAETNPVVKAAIEKALDAVAGPRITSDTEVYLVIAKLTDKSGRTGNDLSRLVRSGMSNASTALPTYALAPRWENEARSRRRLAEHGKLKCFYLSPRLPPFEYADGALVVRLEVAMFSYPAKAMIGTFSVKLTQPDVAPGDQESENDLVKMAAERAVMKFAKLVPGL